MKISGLFALLLVVLGFGACKKDQVGSLTLHFKAQYDGQPLATFETHPFENGEQLQFTHLSMLVSDLRLFKQANEENLDDIELVDLSFDQLVSAQDGYIMTIKNIPANSYEGIRFGLGVPPDINQKTPADFPSSSPLSKTGYYWVAWNSYIFSKTEGRLDTLGNGNLDTGFAMHIGSDKLFRNLEGTLPLLIEDGKETNLIIALDYKKLLAGVDIKLKPQNHTPQDTVLISKMVNNFASAFSLIQ